MKLPKVAETLTVVEEAAIWGLEHDVSVREAKRKAEDVIELIHERVWMQNAYPPDVLEDKFRLALFELGYYLGRTYQDVPNAFKEVIK